MSMDTERYGQRAPQLLTAQIRDTGPKAQGFATLVSATEDYEIGTETLVMSLSETSREERRWLFNAWKEGREPTYEMGRVDWCRAHARLDRRARLIIAHQNYSANV